MNEIDPRDRITDHALREAFGQVRHPDLTARVVAAWQRGERGVDLAEWAAEEARRPTVARTLQPARARSARRGLWLAAAAAAVLVLGGAVFWALRGGGEEARVPFARASAPLRVFRGPDLHELTGTDLAAGDITLVGAGDVAWVDLAASGRLVAGPCSLLGFAEVGAGQGRHALRLHRGRFEASGATQALAVDVGFARFVASPATRFEAEIALDAADLACEAVHGPEGLRALLARLPEEPRRLRLSVASGGIELEHEGQRETLAAGASRELFGPASPTRLVSAQGRKDVLVQLDYLENGPRLEGPVDSIGLMSREYGLIQKLVDTLDQSPQYWPLVRSELSARAARPTLGKGGITRFVAFALAAPPREGVPLARDLWMAKPGGFAEEHVVMLAERKLAEFERELTAAVHGYEPGDKLPVLAAASLAAGGDEKALAVLRAYLAEKPRLPIAMDIHDRIALAAFTLDRAGDATAWTDGLALGWPEIDRLLARSNWGTAAWVTLIWRYLHERRADTKPMTVTRFLQEVVPYCEMHVESLMESGDIQGAFKGLGR